MTAPGPSVMVVTDATWIENDVRASLTDPGTVIHRVADPRLAVAAADEYGVDVAVVDLQVGSKGGMAVVRALRAAVESGDIGPVRTVLLLDRDADQFLAHRAGADAALVKPFTAQDLRAAVAVPAEV
ncbi:MAG: response regulator [Acidimicrobiia bacterium]